MKNVVIIAAGLLLAVLLISSFAEAGRLGGGQSFGSKPSYGNSYSKPMPPSQSFSQPSTPSQPFTQNQPLPPQQPVGGKSRFGGMGGMLGGLLMGGLLGSMFFGGHGGGGIGLMEILLVGGGIYLLFKFIINARRQGDASGQPAQPGGYAPPPYRPEPGEYDTAHRQAETGWDRLRSTPPPASDGTGEYAGVDYRNAQAPSFPPGFDEAEFLKGAKAVYARLQEAWDKRDLEDIRQFSTQEVYEEIKAQAKADPKPGRTELLLVNARTLEVKTEGSETVATVYYDVLMRESQAAQQPSQVREVWHFRRDDTVKGDTWRLEGIQQLDN
jgi:predicted lipid-binding transport protein (Tim44 family)